MIQYNTYVSLSLSLYVYSCNNERSLKYELGTRVRVRYIIIVNAGDGKYTEGL